MIQEEQEKISKILPEDEVEKNLQENYHILGEGHFADPKAKKITHLLINQKNITADNLNIYKNLLTQIKDNSQDYFKYNKFHEAMFTIDNFIFKNLEDEGNYRLIFTYNETLKIYKQTEAIKSLIGYTDNELDVKMHILQSTLDSFLSKHTKAKNSRRNLKTRLRAQRKLAEKTEELNKVENITKEMSRKAYDEKISK